MKDIIINNIKIGSKFPPFIIAEMSGNHNSSLDRALEIVDAAAATGVHALKLQTYTADTMTLDIDEGEFFINDPKSLWKGETLYKLYKKAHTPWDWHQKIFDRCKEKGLICFSTPFDDSAVDFLEDLNVPLYKISSFENVDLPLIEKVAKTGKPLLLSIGMATLEEIDDAVIAFRKAGGRDLVLLKCTSAYPASPKEANLETIPYLKDRFDLQVGLSDHSMGVVTSLSAVSLGATVIEKHFTLNRKDGGVDSQFSMEPKEMKQLVEQSKICWETIGEVHLGPSNEDESSKKYRRSLYVVEDLNIGDQLTQKNVRRIRPGLGLSPKYYHQIIGKKAIKKIKRGTPLSWDLIR